MSKSGYTTTAPPNIPPPPTGATGVPVELQRLDQWLAYRAVPKPNGKINKPPIDAKTGESGSSTNPATWSTYELAAKRSPVGAAFVLTLDDPYFALDIDECVDPETGEITPEAQTTVDRFPIYWEISYSKTGLRGIGRGVIPKDGCKKPNTEVYDHARLVVMTGRTLPGHETIRNCQRELTKWHNEVWPVEPARPVPPLSTPSSSTSLNLDDLLAKAFGAKNGDKVRRLHEGDISGYPESQSDPGFSSEADLALAGYYCFYTADDGLVAEAMRSSKLYRKKMDRQDYIDRTIQRVRTNQAARWDPSYGQRAPLPMIVPPVAVGATCDEQLKHAQDTIVLLTTQLQDAQQTITVREGVIERERELRIAAQQRAERLGFERSQIMQILRNSDLGAGEKLTHFTTVIDLGARIANGEVPAPAGFRLPAIKIADQTGQSVQTVRNHWKKLNRQGVIQKTNVREQTERNSVDPETGEISTATGMREVSHISVPENNIIHLIVPAANYARPEEETGHGGKRKPRCEEHPDAATVKHWHVECAECHVVLERGEIYQAPQDQDEESSPINLIGEKPPVSNTVYSPTRLIPEKPDFDGYDPLWDTKNSPIKMTGEPPLPPEPEPWWWNEGVGS